MDPYFTPITGRHNEDVFKNAFLGKPTESQHYIHARHPRPHDPPQEHFKDYLDMLKDHHHDIPNTARWFLKGAFGGALYGLMGATLLKQFNSIALRKLSYYIRGNTFGRIELYRDFLTPYMLGGGLVGSSFYLFYYKWWTKNSSWSPMWDKITGFGIFGSLLSVLLIHPGLYWAGFYAGATVGLASFFMYQGNIWGNVSTPGFHIELPGLTEEEREKQRNKDTIHWLSLNDAVNSKTLIKL